MTDTQPSPEQIADAQQVADAQQAQTEVQQLLTSIQTQALYDALVQARTEVAGLKRRVESLEAEAQEAPEPDTTP